MTATAERPIYVCPAWCTCPMDERFAPHHFWDEDLRDGSTFRQHTATYGSTDIIQTDHLIDGVAVPGVPSIIAWGGAEPGGTMTGMTAPDARALAADLLAAAGLLDQITAQVVPTSAQLGRRS